MSDERTWIANLSAPAPFTADVMDTYVPAPPLLSSVGVAEDAFEAWAVTIIIKSPTSGVAVTVFVPEFLLYVDPSTELT